MAGVDHAEAVDTTAEIRIDVSAIAKASTRAWIAASIEEVACSRVQHVRFWKRFPHRPEGLPKNIVVVSDLTGIARSYLTAGQLQWVAGVRKSLPVLVGLLRTKHDTSYAGLVDDIVKRTDGRLWVSDDMKKENVLRCLGEAMGSIEPHSIIAVRCGSTSDELFVEFGDGLCGFVRLSQLELADIARDLVASSAAVGDEGFSVQMITTGGAEFDIDSASIRSTLDSAYARRLSEQASRVAASVGQAVRNARLRACLTQSELSEMTGIDQALISKLERGVHRPRIDTLRRISAGLDTDLSTILADIRDAVA